MTNYQDIDATDCSDEDILNFMENVKGSDAKHYQANWIMMRTLKILAKKVKDLEYIDEQGI